jgi:precorrin-2 dehydrogenase/sirohydrochlorin ferrochelatase
MQYYPVFLNLAQHSVVVIGGGKMAHEKVEGLLRAGACVTLIAREPSEPLQELAAGHEITLVARDFKHGDLAAAFLVISTLNDRKVNAQIFREANARNIPVNVVDDPPHCSFIAPSILRRGDLTVAISTSGKAPAVAVRLRQQLEEQIGDEYAHFLEIAGTLRAPLAEKYPDFETRKKLWYDVVDSDVLELLRAGDETRARERITELMGV